MTRLFAASIWALIASWMVPAGLPHAYALPARPIQAIAAQSSPIILVQGRRDDASKPIIQAPNRRRGGSLLGNAPFASPTAPVFPRKPQSGSAPVVSSPPGSGGDAADAETVVGVPEAQTVPPYEKEILRLSELLGSLHYLRGLCGADEGGLWRDEMEQLVAAEPDNAVWRARLKQSFNAGYSGFGRTYRTCTPSAARAAGLFMDEGKTLIAAIRTRYAY